MMRSILFLGIVLFFSAGIVSSSASKLSKPVITNDDVNLDNTHVAFLEKASSTADSVGSLEDIVDVMMAELLNVELVNMKSELNTNLDAVISDAQSTILAALSSAGAGSDAAVSSKLDVIAGQTGASDDMLSKMDSILAKLDTLGASEQAEDTQDDLDSQKSDKGDEEEAAATAAAAAPPAADAAVVEAAPVADAAAAVDVAAPATDAAAAAAPAEAPAADAAAADAADAATVAAPVAGAAPAPPAPPAGQPPAQFLEKYADDLSSDEKMLEMIGQQDQELRSEFARTKDDALKASQAADVKLRKARELMGSTV